MEKEKIAAGLDTDSFRQNLARFTRQAWSMLPPMKEPRILDLGCGTGVPTIQIAVLSGGHITAVDSDARALARLREKADALMLSPRIKTLKADISRRRFKKAHFDIIWSEGAIASVGFEEGLSAWKEYVRPGGYIVLHDENEGFEEKATIVLQCGLELAGHFTVRADVWMEEYFRPMERRIGELKKEYADKPEMLSLLSKEEEEVEAFKAEPNRFTSVFMIIRKTEV